MTMLRSLFDRVLTTVFGHRVGIYNGVAVRDRSLLDPTDHEPEFKADLVRAVRMAVEPGDAVVVVGGGRSVVAVHAARVGGCVTVYEAAKEMVSLTADVRALNGVEFDLRHAIVGNPVDVYGDTTHALRVEPREMTGDVLVLDCEGAEQSILPDVDGFRDVIVETHPAQGSPTEEIVELTDGEVVGSDPVDGKVVVA